MKEQGANRDSHISSVVIHGLSLHTFMNLIHIKFRHCINFAPKFNYYIMGQQYKSIIKFLIVYIGLCLPVTFVKMPHSLELSLHYYMDIIVNSLVLDNGPTIQMDKFLYIGSYLLVIFIKMPRSLEYAQTWIFLVRNLFGEFAYSFFLIRSISMWTVFESDTASNRNSTRGFFYFCCILSMQIMTVIILRILMWGI